jgi:hypothetical protein
MFKVASSRSRELQGNHSCNGELPIKLFGTRRAGHEADEIKSDPQFFSPPQIHF